MVTTVEKGPPVGLIEDIVIAGGGGGGGGSGGDDGDCWTSFLQATVQTRTQIPNRVGLITENIPLNFVIIDLRFNIYWALI
jgi:hypothetical protein